MKRTTAVAATAVAVSALVWKRATGPRTVQPDPDPVPVPPVVRVVPSTLNHEMLAYGWFWQDDDYGPGWQARELGRTSNVQRAEFISSRLLASDGSGDTGLHAPVLDLDLNSLVIPSRTAGHSHLYLDMEMSWRTYRQLLKALAEAGIIEKDWARVSRQGGQSLLRTPWPLNGDPTSTLGRALRARHQMMLTEGVMDRDYDVFCDTRLVPTNDPGRAEFLSSRRVMDSTRHAPALDLDVPAYLVASTTPGHFHLYLDVEMTWRTYRRLLKALAKAGVIEKDWAKASIACRHTFVRAPWVIKG